MIRKEDGDILTEKEKEKSFCIIQVNPNTGEQLVISQELKSCEFSEDSGLVHFFCGDTGHTVSVSISLEALRLVVERTKAYSKEQAKINYVDSNTKIVS